MIKNAIKNTGISSPKIRISFILPMNNIPMKKGKRTRRDLFTNSILIKR
jgi:hypothetical protein